MLNAYTKEILVKLDMAIKGAVDDDVYAVVLTGTGKGFCSGKDVSVGSKPSYRMEKVNHLRKVALAMTSFGSFP